MKKVCVFGVFIILVTPSLFSKENGPPVATLTEVDGMVEIQSTHGWERLAPLLPLAAGDTIRVTKPGKAVLMYLGGSPEVITEANSPYLVRKANLGKGKGEKAAEKLSELFKGLFTQGTAHKVNLVVRGEISSDKVVQPDKTEILFSYDPIVFQWQGQKRPYKVAVFRHEKGKESVPIFSAATTNTSIPVPIEKFQQDASYDWVVAAGSEHWDGRFTLKSKTETQILLNDLSELLEIIPKAYPLTRAIIQGEFFMEKKLFYDAYRFLEKSLSRFPESEALHRLFARFNSD